MSAHILTLNAGSSSLKTALYAGHDSSPVMTGLIERIGTDPFLKARWTDGTVVERGIGHPEAGHAGAMKAVLDLVLSLAKGEES